jgi:hypothetical protein
VECFIAQLNKLLTHYGSSSGLGIHMQVSMEVLIIEGGVSAQILSEPFSHYGKWVTHCWLQFVWEKVDMFNFRVDRDICHPPTAATGARSLDNACLSGSGIQ